MASELSGHPGPLHGGEDVEEESGVPGGDEGGVEVGQLPPDVGQGLLDHLHPHGHRMTRGFCHPEGGLESGPGRKSGDL